MSWSSESVIIAGYMVPMYIYEKAYKKWGEQSNPDDEDYFIDTNPAIASGDFFCGSVIYSCDNKSCNIDKLYFTKSIVDNVNAVFDKYFLPIYKEENKELPDFSKWLVTRYY